MNAQSYWSIRYDLDSGNNDGRQVVFVDTAIIVFDKGLCNLNNVSCGGYTKVSKSGDVIHSNIFYDTLETNYVESLVYRKDTFFVNLNYLGVEGKDYTVYMFDLDGNKIGTHDYFYPSQDVKWSRGMAINDSTQFVKFTYTDTTSGIHKETVIAFTSQWEEKWNVTIPPKFHNVEWCDMETTDDGGLALVYSYVPAGTDSGRVHIEKYTAGGAMEWRTLIPRTYNDWGNWVKLDNHPDGGYVGLWIVDSFGLYIVNQPSYLFKLNAEGEIEWELLNWQHERQITQFDIFAARNGDIITCGYEEDNPWNMDEEDDYIAGYIARYHSDGVLRWQRRLFDHRDAGQYFLLYGGNELPNGDLVFAGDIRDTLYKVSEDSIPPYPGNTWVIKVDSNGCFEPGCGDDQHLTSSIELPLPSAESPFIVWPNPAHDHFTLGMQTGASPGKGQFSASLYNMTGQMLLTRLINPRRLSRFKIGDYPSGIYLLAIRRDGRLMQTLKVVLE